MKNMRQRIFGLLLLLCSILPLQGMFVKEVPKKLGMVSGQKRGIVKFSTRNPKKIEAYIEFKINELKNNVKHKEVLISPLDYYRFINSPEYNKYLEARDSSE
jgi:hypothetical protein